MSSIDDRLRRYLDVLYGQNKGKRVWPRLKLLLTEFQRNHPELSQRRCRPENRLDETDAFLITYGDLLTHPNEFPLNTLKRFLDEYVRDAIHGVHLLPFFPYSSDAGFSIVDYLRVNSDLGKWSHIHEVSQDYRLMVDAVINHVSRQSAWFQGFCRNEPPYDEYFITVDPRADLSEVERPRATPLLTPVETSEGTAHVWTTFSQDQVDLNFSNPEVLLEIVDILLFYVAQGVDVIRLDAIAYLWKEIGTSCIHLPETHELVKLLRAVLDAVAPDTILITETNVPHAANVSYFGDGTDEAQMVYNFSLPPLILHAFHTGCARRLNRWIETHMRTPSAQTAFFNFTASHDGIGLMPVRDLLEEAELGQLVERTRQHGGLVSYKTASDGSQRVYELNITYYDALNDPADPHPELDVKRFMASQAIMLALPGVPGIYVHSLLGSRNCHACVELTEQPRSINREQLDHRELQRKLATEDSRRARVFQRYLRLLRLRQQQQAFHPNAAHEVVPVNDRVFGLIRTPENEPNGSLICLVNVSDRPETVELALARWPLPLARRWHDLIGDGVLEADGEVLDVELTAFQAMWLRPVAP